MRSTISRSRGGSIPRCRTGYPLDKIKFPYAPISYHSLPWLVAYEAKLFEKYGLEVDPLFAFDSEVVVN